MKNVMLALFAMVICSQVILSCKKSGESSGEPNTPPSAPANPAPADAAVNVSVSPVLSWSYNDPDPGDTLTFDIYLGLNNPPDTLLVSGWKNPNFTAGPLDVKKTYYWRVTAHDSHGASTAGPVWSFTTLADFPVQGLVAYFPFNGNANDESGNGHNGTPMNGIMLSTDRFGNGSSAWNFDGIDDYILIGNSAGVDLGSNFTLTAWLFSDAPSGPSDSVFYTIIAKRDEVLSGDSNHYPWDFCIDYGHSDYFRVPMAGRTGSNAWATGIVNALMWEFAVVTVENNVATFWINGVQRGTTQFTTGSVTTTQSILIGWDRADKNQYRGKIDDVRIFSRPLPESEILELFHEAGWK